MRWMLYFRIEYKIVFILYHYYLFMKVFVKDPTSGLTQTHYVEESSLVADLK